MAAVKESFHHQVRKPAVAGQFYPETQKALKEQLTELFSQAVTPEERGKAPRAIISPHAGYVYSGAVAASAFNQIPENARYRKVFVLASSHHYLFGGASVYYNNYSTPLGEIKVDPGIAGELIRASSMFMSKPEVHDPEHSLEVELPFLQYKLGDDFELVPIILGTNNRDDCKTIAQTLMPYFTPENLFVISSDFSHFPGYRDACQIDRLTAQAICQNSPDKLLQVLENNRKKNIPRLATSLCGWTSVLTLLYLTENQKVSFREIEYRNSGDATLYGDKKRVVGYWALSVFATEDAFRVSEEEKAELLRKTRKAIAAFLETGKRNPPEPCESKGMLNEKTGVFVSLYVEGILRGCMGNFGEKETLNDLAQQMAVSAACDRRFEPVTAKELDMLELEISVLSPLKKIRSTNEIELGKHGILIKKGFNSGTFLPQVAQKNDWDLEKFLGHCSRDKAGLGWEGWKDADLFTYEAQIFRG